MVQKPKSEFKKQRKGSSSIGKDAAKPGERGKMRTTIKQRGNKQKENKSKIMNVKGTRILNSTSTIKNPIGVSKIPIPLSQSTTYKKTTVPKHKIIAPKKKRINSPTSKLEYFRIPSLSDNGDISLISSADRFTRMRKDNNVPRYEQFNHKDYNLHLKTMKKKDTDNLKRMNNQYFSSIFADMHRTEIENELQRHEIKNNQIKPKELKKKKRKFINKKIPQKMNRTNPKIVGMNTVNNDSISINPILKDSPSLTTHYLQAETQISKIPITRKQHKTVKPKKSARSKLNVDKDAKSTQITQHHKKSKANTLKLKCAKSCDSVPNLPIREIKHNDSFVLSAKKLEHSSIRRATHHAKSPEQLKLKMKLPGSPIRSAFKTTENKGDVKTVENLKSCLKKNLDNITYPVIGNNNKYEMNFGLVPLIVN